MLVRASISTFWDNDNEIGIDVKIDIVYVLDNGTDIVVGADIYIDPDIDIDTEFSSWETD